MADDFRLEGRYRVCGRLGEVGDLTERRVDAGGKYQSLGLAGDE
jgi:hypothetical protein